MVYILTTRDFERSVKQPILLQLLYWSFNNIKAVWRYPKKICLILLDQTFEQRYDEKPRNWQRLLVDVT